MADHHHRWVGNLFWRLMLVTAVVLAIYVSVGRVMLSALPQYQAILLTTLNTRMGVALEVKAVSGRLQGFAPVIILQNVTFNYGIDAEKSLRFAEASVEVDPWESLLSLSPRFTEVILNSPEIDVEIASNGEVQSANLTDLADVLRAFRKIVVTDGRLTIHSADGPPLVASAQVDYRRQGSERLVRARLKVADVANISLQADGIGNPFDFSAFAGELHGVIEVADLARASSLLGVSASGAGVVNFWYRVKQQTPSLAATISGANLALDIGADKPLQVDRLATDLLLERSDRGWFALLQNSQLTTGAAHFELPRLQLQQIGATARIGFADLDVEPLIDWLSQINLLPERAVSVLETLAPSGVVDAAEVRITNTADWMTNWTVSAEVRNATTQVYLGVPGLKGIDAYIEAANTGAQAWIDSDGFVLELPKVYREPLIFERVTGRLSARWQTDVLYLEQGLLNAQRAAHDATVQFGMQIPLRRDSGHRLTMDLAVAASDADIAIRNDYIPYIISPKLFGWLDTALPVGHIDDVAFLWRGALSDFSSADQTMQIAAQVSHTTLKFQPDWLPLQEVSATLVVDDGRVSGFSQSARLSSAFVEHTSVEVAASRGLSPLRVVARASDNVPDGLAVLAASPLGPRVDTLLTDLSSTGRAEVDLDLALDLNDVGNSLEIDVGIALNAASLHSKILNLDVTDISGGLDFTSRQGFVGRELTANFYDQPLAIDIGPGANDLLVAPLFAGRFAAQVSGESALAWAGLALAPPITGSTEVVAEIAVGDTAQLRVSSTLAGMQIDLPTPIGKAATQTAPITIAFDIDADAPIDVFWQGRLTARGYRRTGQLVGGVLDVTPRSSPFNLSEPSNTEGFYLTGYIPSLDVDQWLEALSNHDLYGNTENRSTALTIEALAFDRVRFGGADIGAINVDLKPFDGWDMLGLNADWLDAELTLLHGDGGADLIINTLDLDRLPKLGATGGSPEPPVLSNSLNVVIANLRHGDASIGAASFLLSSEAGELRVQDIRGQLAQLEFLEGSELIWRAREGGPAETHLTLNGRYDDFGDTLEALSLARSIDTRSGTASANLHWAGSPSDVAITQLQGNIDLKMKNGAFLPVPAGATGALRILSLLNLADLLGRANITQLFDAGVTFDRAQGDFLFDRGQLTIPSFKIDGSGGKFEFVSTIDLIAEQIDGDLVVTLPLVKNIPWVAALAGGLPVAAGAFLISKVFEDQFKTLTSAVYSVNGDLAQPVVKFERVFDASSQKGKTNSDASDASNEGTVTTDSVVADQAKSAVSAESAATERTAAEGNDAVLADGAQTPRANDAPNTKTDDQP